MDSIREAYLMLNTEDDKKFKVWQICGLVIHAYNLRNGIICTGFDEDEEKPQNGENVLNLPENILEKISEIMTFRYQGVENKDEEILLKIIPSDDFKTIDINAMSSLKDDEILSVTIDISMFEDPQNLQTLIDNPDKYV